MLVSMAGAYAAVSVPPPAKKFTAESAVLMDAATGTVLFDKACHLRRPPASTTKMMTAILALEHGNLDDVVTVSVHASKTAFGNLHVKPGEKFTLKDLLYAMLMRSANDAAVVIAQHIAGSEGKFADMMNAKAREIGAKDTHFVNPHGLYNPNHYSTAYDLALIARYATSLPEFNKIVKTKNKRINRTISKLDCTLRSSVRLLWRYPGADGIKTGYTKEAGHCFVGSATRNGMRLITVVLKSGNSIDDTSLLLDRGFSRYKLACFARKGHVVAKLPVVGGLRSSVDLVPMESLGKVMKISDPVKTRYKIDRHRVAAPVAEGEKLCMLTGYVNGKKLGSVPLLAASSVNRTFLFTLRVWARNIVILLILLLTTLMAYGTATAKIARRRRRRLTARG